MSVRPMIPCHCPPWCTREHTPESWAAEGWWLHEAEILTGPHLDVTVVAAEGEPNMDGPPTVGLWSTPTHELPPAEARRIAAAILRAADLAEGVQS